MTAWLDDEEEAARCGVAEPTNCHRDFTAIHCRRYHHFTAVPSVFSRRRSSTNKRSSKLVTGMRIPVPAHPAGTALVLAYGVTIRDEGHREHVSGQADPYDEP